MLRLCSQIPLTQIPHCLANSLLNKKSQIPGSTKYKTLEQGISEQTRPTEINKTE